MKFHPYSIFYPKDNTHLFQIKKRSFLSIFLSFSLSFSLATPDLQLIFPINLDNKHSSETTSDNARRNTTKTELVSISNNTTTGKYHVVNLYPGRMFLVSFSNVAPTGRRRCNDIELHRFVLSISASSAPLSGNSKILDAFKNGGTRLAFSWKFVISK